MPASMSFFSISSLSLAGPIVQIIFVFLKILSFEVSPETLKQQHLSSKRKILAQVLRFGKSQRFTRAPLPAISASTSSTLAIDVSPGVVIASAPCAAPYSTAFFGSPVVMSP